MAAAFSGLRRRQALQALALAGLQPLWVQAARAASPQGTALAAAWMQGTTQFIGVLDTPTPGALHIRQAVEVPTRAHGMVELADGSLLFAARRPGDWLLRLQAGQEPQWLWIEPDRVFNGHLIASADGRHLYTTETDLADSQGLIGVRDMATLEKIAEWPTHGMDPHQLLLDAQGQLMVANGGIPTQPETGRRKLQLPHMDSSIVRLQPADGGALLGQWKLPDARLSLRHLSWGAPVAWRPQQRWLGIALQAEHDETEDRQQAPVLALWDGERLDAVPLPRPLAGYGGDIAWDGRAFVVSCPRVHGCARFALPHQAGQAGQLQDFAPLEQAYSLAAAAPQEAASAVWIGGSKAVQLQSEQGPRQLTLPQAGLLLDNHWLRLHG